jgi:hypothetical protein
MVSSLSELVKMVLGELETHGVQIGELQDTLNLPLVTPVVFALLPHILFWFE